MEHLLLYAILGFNLALILVIGLFARSRSGFYFALSVVGISLWTLSIILTERNPEPSSALVWSRFSFLFPIWIILSFHPFIYALMRDTAKKRIYGRGHLVGSSILYGLGALFSYLCFSPLILESVIDLRSTFGPYQPAYSLYSFLSITYVIYLLYHGTVHLRGRKGAQFSIMLVGIGLSSVLALITNLVLPQLGYGEIRFLGPAGLIFFIALTAYAIVAQHLFDIRIIIRRTVVYSGLLGFALGAYSMVIFFFSALFGGANSGNAFEPKTFFANLAAAGLIAIGFDPLRRWLQNRTDSFLYKKEYEQQLVLRDLSKRLNDVVALDEALDIMMQTIVKTLHLRHAVTYVFQQGEAGGAAIKRIKQIGYQSMTPLYLAENDLIVPFFSSSPGILLVENLEHDIETENLKLNYVSKEAIDKLPKEAAAALRQHGIKQAVLKKLKTLSISAAIPLHLNEQPIGLILLSRKLSGDPYGSEDVDMLETIGSQAISSIQKAKLYEGDQMKSEFVSIASHELLTPIAAMEGYLSMILDENIGQIDDQARNYLAKVYTSSKRLSVLIKDLLSVSRIEAGRMKIDPQSLDIGKMVNDTIDQLRFIAEEKKLALSYASPSDPLPPAWADPDRTMQILVNLVSNAIKYTPSGSVTVRTAVAQQPVPHIRIDIIDTGMGMTKQAQSHLFEKFYRVSTPETTGIIGTGLGLYITKSLIERMGGSISLKSVPDQGSTFSFTLPIFKAEPSAALH